VDWGCGIILRFCGTWVITGVVACSCCVVWGRAACWVWDTVVLLVADRLHVTTGRRGRTAWVGFGVGGGGVGVVFWVF